MSSPPHPPKLAARATKVKGIKALEKMIGQIEENATWNGIDTNIEVLLDATRAMGVLHESYEDGSMNDIARKFFGGEEDDLAEGAWGTLTESWLTVLLHYPELFSKKVVSELEKIGWGDFEGMEELMEHEEYQALLD